MPVFDRHYVVDRLPATLLGALSDLMKWLDATKMPSMVIGGVAASVLGRPRPTQHVDALAILPAAVSTSDMLEDFDRLVAQGKSMP